MFFLEVLTYFVIRPLTLALRLFGNMLAGHLMLLVFILGGEYLLSTAATSSSLSGVLGLAFGVVMTFFELLWSSSRRSSSPCSPRSTSPTPSASTTDHGSPSAVQPA